ncbi:MAG TPA: hypothetical protein VLR49_09130 [Ferruginibacter sp.]|nr:hypothetical protein [Ferruginibacter sp.]
MAIHFLRNSFTATFLLMTFVAQAQGDLLITPKRLVFDGSKRAEEINLANIGKDTATYSISFMQFKMDENGNFIAVSEEDSTQNFAHKNLRFFPRTVTLAPNEAQSVKVQLIRVNELLPGEYRSHLFFKNVLNKTALGEEPQEATKDSGISVNIKPVFGISIATIIRVGQTNVEGHFSNSRFIAGTKTDDASINFTLNRTGNISLYGDLKVSYIGTDNKSTQLTIMKGLAIYTPNAIRNVHLPLKNLPGIDYTQGKLLVEYTNPSAKNDIICKTEIVF